MREARRLLAEDRLPSSPFTQKRCAGPVTLPDRQAYEAIHTPSSSPCPIPFNSDAHHNVFASRYSSCSSGNHIHAPSFYQSLTVESTHENLPPCQPSQARSGASPYSTPPRLLAEKAAFASSLRNCTSTIALSEGMSIHHCILQSELSEDGFLANILVQMYGRSGSFHDSLSLFARLPQRNQYAWNFMIRAYDQDEQSQEAVFLYDHMLREACLPDKHIYTSILCACASSRDLVCGVQMHARVVGQGSSSDVVVGNNLVSMYAKCGQIEDASYVFQELDERSAMPWTVLIAAYAEYGHHDRDVVQLIQAMQQDDTPLDRVTFVSILSACANRGALSEGKHVHKLILECGFSREPMVANSLLNMYGKCGSVKDAWQVFVDIEEQDLVSWSAMIAALAQCGQGLDALEIFCQMQMESFLPNKVTLINILYACADKSLLLAGKHLHIVISCQGLEEDVAVGTAILNMYRNCGDLGNALAFYRDLPIKDEGANVSILTVCASHGTILDGRQAHAVLTACGADVESNISVALVNMYGKCGCLQEARATFDLAPKHDVVLWNAMAATYAQNGGGLEALDLFQQMQIKRVKPGKATFCSLLTACSHAGFKDEAYSFFVSSSHGSEAKLVTDQYNCIADLLARMGSLDEACDLLNSMPLKPSVVSWLTLLSICRVQVEVKMGEYSAKHVMELDPEISGSYVMLANIYCYEQGE